VQGRKRKSSGKSGVAHEASVGVRKKKARKLGKSKAGSPLSATAAVKQGDLVLVHGMYPTAQNGVDLHGNEICDYPSVC
jgi:hypothetical protein